MHTTTPELFKHYLHLVIALQFNFAQKLLFCNLNPNSHLIQELASMQVMQLATPQFKHFVESLLSIYFKSHLSHLFLAEHWLQF